MPPTIAPMMIIELIVEHRHLAGIFLVIENRPAFVLLEVLVDEIGPIGDAGIAPVGRRHHHLAVYHHAIRVCSAGKRSFQFDSFAVSISTASLALTKRWTE